MMILSFDQVRADLFGGTLTQSQVDGLNVLLSAWSSSTSDHRWIAYGLATAYHETDRTMEPIAEYGHGLGRPYGKPDPTTGLTYYGRGYVQLTWDYNYIKMGHLLGIDLYRAPERAMEPEVAAKIMTAGMVGGLFTGQKLADHFNDRLTDWVGARRIINGLDRAHIIAGYGETFARALASG